MSASKPEAGRRVRADAQRNIDALIGAAREAFAASGTDASVREITTRAGVGLATFYRHFPERADLITAVFRDEVDACADRAAVLAAELAPMAALAAWLNELTVFLAGRRGFADAVQSGNAAFQRLPSYFRERFEPALAALLTAAAEAGEIRAGADPGELLGAVKRLCASGDTESNQRIVALILDGLSYRAARPGPSLR